MIDPKTLRGDWNYPTSIRFGSGRVAELPQACAELGIRRPLLVTDPNLATCDFVHVAVDSCRRQLGECGLFCEVQSNPTEANVNAGVAAYQTGAHDSIIAFGGGSALDTGKAIALMVGQSRPLWDFEDREDWWTRAHGDRIAPCVAVPTTAGTGSEVGRAAVITDCRNQTKKIIFHPEILPARVICDPVLTIGLPAHLTAAVGMDALSHNLEAYCSPLFHPLAHGIALEGLRLIHRWLPVACADGNNRSARAYMQVAALMGATAFQKGLGAMHALSHPCGAVKNTHHGLTNAVVMPYVLEFNRTAIEASLVLLARYLNLPGASFDAVLDWIVQLRATIGIPHRLDQLGIELQDVATLAPMAANDPSAATNPIKLTTENLTQLYRNAIEGRLGL